MHAPARSRGWGRSRGRGRGEGLCGKGRAEEPRVSPTQRPGSTTTSGQGPAGRHRGQARLSGRPEWEAQPRLPVQRPLESHVGEIRPAWACPLSHARRGGRQCLPRSRAGDRDHAGDAQHRPHRMVATRHPAGAGDYRLGPGHRDWALPEAKAAPPT